MRQDVVTRLVYPYRTLITLVLHVSRGSAPSDCSLRNGRVMCTLLMGAATHCVDATPMLPAATHLLLCSCHLVPAAMLQCGGRGSDAQRVCTVGGGYDRPTAGRTFPSLLAPSSPPSKVLLPPSLLVRDAVPCGSTCLSHVAGHVRDASTNSLVCTQACIM